jgi:hypothetical protein
MLCPRDKIPFSSIGILCLVETRYIFLLEKMTSFLRKDLNSVFLFIVELLKE